MLGHIVHFPWLLTFLKIVMTFPGLEISNSNSMSFPGFLWLHEPRCWLQDLYSTIYVANQNVLCLFKIFLTFTIITVNKDKEKEREM